MYTPPTTNQQDAVEAIIRAHPDKLADLMIVQAKAKRLAYLIGMVPAIAVVIRGLVEPPSSIWGYLGYIALEAAIYVMVAAYAESASVPNKKKG